MATKSVRTSKTSVKKTANTGSGAVPKKTAAKAGVKPENKPAAKKMASAPKAASARKTAAPKASAQTNKTTLRGRSVFVVQTTEAGVVVRSAWLSEDKKLQEMPAVFPNVDYAINVLDDLKRQVLKHFSQAAQVGAQAIANQRASKATGKS